MNKKISALLIVFIAAISVASVCASELKAYDFDGKFTMDIPDNAEVKKINETTVTEDDEVVSTITWTIDKDTLVLYCNQPIEVLQPILESGDKFIQVETDGVLSIFSYTDYDNDDDNVNTYYIVTVSSDKDTVCVGSNDLDAAKEYANSVLFK